jgi:hypothetical protein
MIVDARTFMPTSAAISLKLNPTARTDTEACYATPPADTAIGNLFGEPELPAGFRYMPEVLSPAEEKGLVQRLEKLPLKPFEFHGYLGNRRIHSFGHRYT